MLHGSGRDGMSLVEKWKDLANEQGFIIVGPDAESTSGWSSPKDGPGFLRDLVEALKGKYPINARRVYLFGHSAGAVFALMMSMTESEYFAATAIHAGAFRNPSEFTSIDNAVRKIPLAIWVGTRDPFFHLEDVRATRDAFVAKGFPIEVTEMPEHDHWYYDLAPTINKNAWQFLKRYELTSEPRYTDLVESADAANANKLIAEINLLSTRAREVLQQANDKEKEVAAKDFVADRAFINKTAQEQSDLFKAGAMLWRQAADKAQAAAQLNVGEKNKQYLVSVALYYRKWAEVMDALREKSEALLTQAPFETVQAKRIEAQKRADRLHAAADELERAAQKNNALSRLPVAAVDRNKDREHADEDGKNYQTRTDHAQDAAYAR